VELGNPIADIPNVDIQPSGVVHSQKFYNCNRCGPGLGFSPLQPFSLKLGFGEKRRTLADPQESLALPM
ncbi:MAG: hypothetical protein WCG50_19380, partial [Rhodoferax sp.]|uniref:hypothetical protein n=1 Tax=Rhodoferax sp. TaxID=50421 RepID=UPI003016565C